MSETVPPPRPSQKLILKLKLIGAGDAGAGAGEIAILKIETVAPLGRAPKIDSPGDLLGPSLVLRGLHVGHS